MANLSSVANLQIGPNRIPPAGAVKTAAYSLVAADSGEYVQVGTGGSITIPNSIFSPGDVILIVNTNTSNNITITCNTTATYVAGVGIDRGSVALSPQGIASLFFVSSTHCIITGNVT